MSEDTTLRIGAAIERVIDDLPEGFQLSMHMREGMGVVLLFNPDGDTIPIPGHNNQIADQLADVLDAAVDAAQGFANPIRH